METHLAKPPEIYSDAINSPKTLSGPPPHSPQKTLNLSNFDDNLSPWCQNAAPENDPSDYDSFLEENETPDGENEEDELINSTPNRSLSSHWAEPWSKMNDQKPVENPWSLGLVEESKASDSDWADWPSRTDVEIKHYVSASLPEYKPLFVGAGLANLGNTCFLNAVLQCFTHSVPLLQGLISCNHKVPCDCYSEGFCVLCSLREHIELSILSMGRVVSPWKFVNNLNYFSSGFGRFQQEDAHEFLQCFLDKLEGCCNDSNSKDIESSESNNFVKQVFGGRLVSKLRCCNCGHCSDTYEPSIDISLEIEDAYTLFNALESFTKIEKIEDPETKFTCEKCKEQVSIQKQIMLDQAPSVAAFHLKRFKNDGSFVEKIDKFVAFPLGLDLLPYIGGGQTENAELKYDLYAVVVHIGLSSNSGHYYCFIRSAPGAWYKFDDSKVVWVQEELVLSQDAYILFYVKQGTPWFSSFIETQKSAIDLTILDTSPKSVLDNADVSTSSPSLPLNDQSDANESSDAAEEAFMETFSQPSNERIDDCENKENLILDSVPFASSNSSVVPSCEAGEQRTESILEDNNSNEEIVEATNAADVSPTTPIRLASPEVYREDRSESAFFIPKSHLRLMNQVSCKRQLNKDLEDLERKQAYTLIRKKMTGSRRQQLLAAMKGSLSEGSVNKKRSRGMRSSHNNKDRNSSARRRCGIPLLAGLR